MKKIKVLSSAFVLVAVLLTAFVSCEKQEANDPEGQIKVESVVLNPQELTLVAGASETLTASVLPEDATNKSVIWVSGDPEIATVEEGLVKAIAEGKTTITVTTEDGGKTALASVIVISDVVPVESVELDKTEAKMKIGETLELKATVLPSNASNKNISWKSSDEKMATVKDGTVSALAEGKVLISVTAEDGGKTAECSVTIVAAASEGDYVDEYGINQGGGVNIDGVVWAPVNCGYHAEDYPCGKLYQWGRNAGQGYNDTVYEDATYPEDGSTILPLLGYGETPADDCFYLGTKEIMQWMNVDSDGNPAFDGTDWNELRDAASAHKDNEGIGNPCPEGWRVPSYEELENLSLGASTLGNEDGFNGRWFGENCKDASKEDPKGCIFLPLAGCRAMGLPAGIAGNGGDRNDYGDYWSSTPVDVAAWFIDMSHGDFSLSMISNSRVLGLSVRCVKE